MMDSKFLNQSKRRYMNYPQKDCIAFTQNMSGIVGSCPPSINLHQL